MKGHKWENDLVACGCGHVMLYAEAMRDANRVTEKFFQCCLCLHQPDHDGGLNHYYGCQNDGHKHEIKEYSGIKGGIL